MMALCFALEHKSGSDARAMRLYESGFVYLAPDPTHR